MNHNLNHTWPPKERRYWRNNFEYGIGLQQETNWWVEFGKMSARRRQKKDVGAGAEAAAVADEEGYERCVNGDS